MLKEFEDKDEGISAVTETCKKIRDKEILVNGILAVILAILGYWLAFSDKRPVDAILKESIVVDAEKHIFTMFPPFYWGSLVVVTGCVMITCSIVHLATMLANLKYSIWENTRNLKLYEEVSFSFRYIFRCILIFLLYITSWDTFEDLANNYFMLMERDFGYYNPMIFQKPFMYIIGVLSFILGLWFLGQIIEGDNSKWLNRMALLLGIVALMGLFLNVSINWWYLFVCLGAIIVYVVIERLIKRKMDKNYEGLCVLLEEIDFKL